MIRIVLIMILIWQSYLFYDLISPPKISIIEPKGRFVFQDNVVIKGKVDNRANLFVNGEQIFPQDNGYFEKRIYLKPGVNRLLFQAKKFWGQESEKELIVIYQKTE